MVGSITFKSIVINTKQRGWHKVYMLKNLTEITNTNKNTNTKTQNINNEIISYNDLLSPEYKNSIVLIHWSNSIKKASDSHYIRGT